MNADSAFTALVGYWLEDMDLEDRLSRTTRQLYERNLRTLVLPFFQDVTLREIGVARCDYFLKQLAKQSYNRARQARVVLRLALGLAVRHEILPRNPMDHVSRLRRPTRSPDVFTWNEITAIRAAIRDRENRPILAGPRPDGQLGQIVEVMLGTSARIGEVLAIRVADLDLDAPVPMVRIAGTIVSRKGEPTHRQDHPKTARSVRRVALPGFTLRAVRARVRSLRFFGPKPFIFVASVVTAGSMAIPLISRTLPALFAQAITTGLALGIYLPVDNAMFIDVLPDPAKAGRGLGLAIVASYVGSQRVPVITRRTRWTVKR